MTTAWTSPTKKAALAADSAGLELDEATPEEVESSAGETSEEERTLTGKSRGELIAWFEKTHGGAARTDAAPRGRGAENRLLQAAPRRRGGPAPGLRRGRGQRREFAPATDEWENRLKELFREYRRRRDEFIASLEEVKQANLQVKLRIIEELKELVDSDETLNHTFTKFRELQQRWKETGIVPSST